jgi:hypothetical protein
MDHDSLRIVFKDVQSLNLRDQLISHPPVGPDRGMTVPDISSLESVEPGIEDIMPA